MQHVVLAGELNLQLGNIDGKELVTCSVMLGTSLNSLEYNIALTTCNT